MTDDNRKSIRQQIMAFRCKEDSLAVFGKRMNEELKTRGTYSLSQKESLAIFGRRHHQRESATKRKDDALMMRSLLASVEFVKLTRGKGKESATRNSDRIQSKLA